MSPRIQQHVFRFKVPIDNVKIVHVGNGKGNLGGIEACPLLGKFAHFPQMEEEFPASTVIQYKVKFILGLECHVQPHDKRVLYIPQYGSFGSGMFHLITLDNVVLLKNLESKHFVCLLFSDEEYFSCRTTMSSRGNETHMSACID